MYTALWKLRREHGILEHLIECPELLTTKRRVPGHLPPMTKLVLRLQSLPGLAMIIFI